MAALGSAPASSSNRIMEALPFSVARNSGVAPSRLAAFGLAPARISCAARSRSSKRAAHCRAVAPSGCAAFTAAVSSGNALTVARSRCMAASARPALDAQAGNGSSPAIMNFQIDRFRAVTEGVLFNAAEAQSRQQQAGGAAGRMDVAAALVAAHRAAGEQVADVAVAMKIRIAHVAG